MKRGENESWCEWHGHWRETLTCQCGESYPTCYLQAHIDYACTDKATTTLPPLAEAVLSETGA